MTGASEPARARFSRIASMCALLALPACLVTPPSDEEAARMAREAEVELRRFAPATFEVTRFSPGAQRDFSLIEYFHENKFHEVTFDAEIKFIAPFKARQPEETRARVGLPGWTLDERDRDFVLFPLFGDGTHAPGEVFQLHAAAMFENLEPGYRFRLIDRPHRSSTQLASGSEGSR